MPFSSDVFADADLRSLAQQLCDHMYVVLPNRCARPQQAWAAAGLVIATAAAEDPLCRTLSPLHVVADYKLPVPGATQRDFQVLHIDFGVPLGIAAHVDVARYTVLYVDAARTASGAATRIVPLAGLATRRHWPPASVLAARLRAREHDPDLAEGVLTRIVEAADESEQLPSKIGGSFLCGLEFDTLEAELNYLADHGLDLACVEHRVVLQPGETLVFDNLGCAHGRLGTRATEELHQRCVGFPSLGPQDQQRVLDHTLTQLTRGDLRLAGARPR
jgi:hypothetical protein